MEGLVTKRTNKPQSAEVLELFQQNDIVMFNETWTFESSDLAIENFEFIALHRTQRKISAKRNSGVLVIYI